MLRLFAPAFLLLLALALPAEARERVTIELAGGARLSGFLFAPATTPAPGVLVLHTAYGSVEPADERYADALAKAGFVALAVNYLENMPAGQLWTPLISRQLVGTAQWLRQRPEVAGKPIGAVGFSLGAHGILLSVVDPGLRAVVVYYGAFDVRTAKGLKIGPSVKLPIDVASEVKAPMLLLHGDKDDEIPPSNATAMAEALKKAGKQVELVIYPGAYHRFDRGPAQAGMSGRRGAPPPYTYRYDAAASQDAMARTEAFFKTNLGN